LRAGQAYKKNNHLSSPCSWILTQAAQFIAGFKFEKKKVLKKNHCNASDAN
jgi:hypothetical protein